MKIIDVFKSKHYHGEKSRVLLSIGLLENLCIVPLNLFTSFTLSLCRKSDYYQATEIAFQWIRKKHYLKVFTFIFFFFLNINKLKSLHWYVWVRSTLFNLGTPFTNISRPRIQLISLSSVEYIYFLYKAWIFHLNWWQQENRLSIEVRIIYLRYNKNSFKS